MKDKAVIKDQSLSDPKKNIRNTYKKYRFDQQGFHLYEDRRQFAARGIQLFATKDGNYKLCFANSVIKNQKQLDDIKKYKIDVHYGTATGYERISWDTSGCNVVNNTGLERLERGYFVCESLKEEDAVNLVNYLSNLKDGEETAKQDASVMARTPKTEIIRYNPLKPYVKGKKYIPVLTVVKRKVYQINSWKEAFKIIMFFCCYKADKMSALDTIIDSTNNRDKTYYIRSSEFTEENKYYVKFSPELYIRDFQKDDMNYEFLNKIRRWIGDFELYLIRADENDKITDIEKLIKEYTDKLLETKHYRRGSTRHLIAGINARTLSPTEKFYLRIGRDFDNSVLIGDIKVNEEEEIYLKKYMYNALTFMMHNEKMYYHDKVFVYGMVRVALKQYSNKTFWPHVKQEYDVDVPANYQWIINNAFKATLKKYERLYYESAESNFVQNMCMHAFVCDKCADQLFDYIFEFWRIDLERSIENCISEEGNNYFDILIDEIRSNKNYAVQNIMLHTTMALEMNPRGCRNRLRRILKMIDDCYWNNADYSGSSNRLSILFDKWINNKNSLFYKDVKSSPERKKYGKGEKLLSKPNLVYDVEDRKFSLYLPKQILRYCTPEECPVWKIMIDGKEYVELMPELIQGKASMYTKECSVDVYKSDIYKSFELMLQSDRANYYRRTIKDSQCRFFTGKGRNVDLDCGYLSKDARMVFSQKEKNLFI